jgi:PAS domain S-box-containing protein
VQKTTFFAKDDTIVTMTESKEVENFTHTFKNSSLGVYDTHVETPLWLHEAYQVLQNQTVKIDTKKKDGLNSADLYRGFFESSMDGILIINAYDGMIVDVNPCLIQMLGYSKKQFIQKNIQNVILFKNIDWSKILFKDLQDDEYVRYENLIMETFDGNQTFVELMAAVYSSNSERFIQYNIRDITSRIGYEKKLTDRINKKELLLKELQHRVKNSFNLITSLIHLRSGIIHSDETRNTLEELTLRVRSISYLYSLLYETDSFYETDLKTYCDRVIQSMINLSSNISIKGYIEEITVPSKAAGLIGMILVELISNAIKYAFPDNNNGLINIELKKEKSQLVLVVEDNGIGLGNDFDITKSKSLGLDLVSLMINQLNGKITFHSENGTAIIISFPV